MIKPTDFDVIILGAGAAGMMCANEAARLGHKVMLLDHAKSVGEKIRISGGGRCNFTNLHSEPKNFLSQNPYFAISALKGYQPRDFIEKITAHNIAYHEKTLGQLFCDGSAKDIIKMFLEEMTAFNVKLHLQCEIKKIGFQTDFYEVVTSHGTFKTESLVVALGGKSIPKIGATGLGYEIAQQFGHKIVDTRPALVPFTWPADMKEEWSKLSGVAQFVRAICNQGQFDEAMLLTHRGLSGPAMLQISSYWQEGDEVMINLYPQGQVESIIEQARKENPKSTPLNLLSQYLPKRLAQQLLQVAKISEKRIADLNKKQIALLSQMINQFKLIPGGTEGYRTAEVTLGGVDTDGLQQKTMESKLSPKLYFIGEVVDVTGHLGGHNFQWAWASAIAAARAI